MRRLIPFVLLLGGCGHLISLPSFHHTAAPLPQTSVVCPGSLSADLLPEPDLLVGAGFPAPTTAAASAATSAYLTWLKSFHDWGKAGWVRANDAKVYCQAHP